MGRRRILGKKDKGGGFRYLYDEVPALTQCYSHLLCRSDYGGNWGEVNSAAFGFDGDGFAILPDEASDRSVALYNQVDGVLDLPSIGSTFDSTDDDWSFGSVRTGNRVITNSSEPFTYATVVSSPSTRSSTIRLLSIGDPAGALGGVRVQITSAGQLEFRLRRNNTIWKRYDAAITDDDLHLVVFTWDGSLTLAGLQVYLDDMTTPLAPTSTSGSTVSSGDFYTTVDYLRFNGSQSDGFSKEYHFAISVLSEADRLKIKEILQQYPLYTFS